MISVIIPAYNAGNTIRRAVDSVLNQTIPIEDIILIDDGSTDDTPQICDDLAAQHTAIRVFHTPNRGVACARNLGIAEAKGEYIGFVDSDDWIAPQMYKILMFAMLDMNADMAACGVIQVTEQGDFSDENNGDIDVIEGEACYNSLLYSKGIRGYLCNKLLKKKLITKGIDERISQCEDLLFIVEYIKNATRVIYINRAMYYYTRTFIYHDYSYDARSLTLIDAYEMILNLYQKNAPSYASLVELYTLKIYLNFRARSKIMKENDIRIIRKIDDGIRTHFRTVIKSGDVSVKQKINIVATYMFPKLILRMKRVVLNIRHRKGMWES